MCQDLGSKDITYKDSTLTTKRLTGEIHFPFTLGVSHVLTMGAEYQHDKLDDPDGRAVYLFPGQFIRLRLTTHRH
ncbi:hypothetical protein [Snodgrassella alvi]|uniref:hypothetical protein n=1 Tax=Snodgrassella alvi TaxID=1196083 RepID=UPI00351C0FE8